MSKKLDYFQRFFLFIVLSLLIGCQGPGTDSDNPSPNDVSDVSNDEPNNPPYIRENGIGWLVQNHHPSYFTKKGQSPDYSASTIVAIAVDDSDGLGDLVYVGFENPDSTRFWAFKDTRYNINIFDHENGYFGGQTCYNSIDPNRVMLGNYQVTIVDSAYNRVEELFRVLGPGGDQTSDFVYSEEYTGSIVGGIPLLKRAQYSNHTMSETSMSIDFSVEDSRVYNGYFWFYDKSKEYVGLSEFIRDDVNGGRGFKVDGSNNNVSISYNDLTFEIGKTLDDIYGFHILLVDVGQYGGEYYDYRSVSEYKYAKWQGTLTSDKILGNDVIVDNSGDVIVVSNVYNNTSAEAAIIEKFSPYGTSRWLQNVELGDDYTGNEIKVAVDSENNIFVAGSVQGYLDDVSSDLESKNIEYIFLKKFNSSGENLWTRVIGSSFRDILHDMVIDQQNNVYLTGEYFSYSIFDGIDTGDKTNAFLVKYNQSGSKQWTKIIANNGNNVANGITVDASGDIYITGRTELSLYGQTNQGGTDIFISKFDGSGDHLMTRQFGGSEDSGEWEEGFAVAVDASGDIFIVGHARYDFNGEERVQYWDGFLVMMDSSGTTKWTRFIGSTSDDKALDVKVDNKGNVYIVGVSGNGDMDGYSNDYGGAFITKYNSLGTRLWTSLFSCRNGVLDNGLDLDELSNVYITGYCDDDYIYMFNDLYLAKYNSSGELQN